MMPALNCIENKFSFKKFVEQFCLVILFLAFLSTRTFAQEDTSSVKTIVTNDIVDVWHDAGSFFSAPLHFDEKEWIITGSIVGGTVILFTSDHAIRDIALRNQSSQAGNVFNIGQQYGSPIYGLALGAGLYVGGLVLKQSDIRTTGVMLYECLGFAGLTTTVLKTLIGRSRPYVGEGEYRFHGLQFNTEHTSLPSGHATVAFSVSSILAERIHNVYATIGLYSLATLTVGARVYNDEHWFSDTFLGAAIGTVSGFAVARLHEQKNDGISLSIVPSIDRIGICLAF